MFTATPDLVEEGDRIWRSHAAWMERTHDREGDKALLLYNLVKGPELEDQSDPSSKPSGNTTYVLTEVYETQAGVDDHWKQAAESWDDMVRLGNGPPSAPSQPCTALRSSIRCGSARRASLQPPTVRQGRDVRIRP